MLGMPNPWNNSSTEFSLNTLMGVNNVGSIGSYEKCMGQPMPDFVQIILIFCFPISISQSEMIFQMVKIISNIAFLVADFVVKMIFYDVFA